MHVTSHVPADNNAIKQVYSGYGGAYTTSGSRRAQPRLRFSGTLRLSARLLLFFDSSVPSALCQRGSLDGHGDGLSCIQKALVKGVGVLP